MADMWVSEVANTFSNPNFTGELYNITPTDTPFLSAIGGLAPGGGRVVMTKEFEDSYYDLPAPAAYAVLEGAEAPTIKSAVRAPLTNVVQIVHEAYGVTYTKSAATGQLDGLGIAGAATSHGPSEWDFQRNAHLQVIARNVENMFLNSTYSVPVDNATARTTRGIRAAITTNVIAAGGATLSSTLLDELMQTIWEAGGLKESFTATIMVNGFQKRMISQAYGFAPDDRYLGGVNVQTILTDFGQLNVMLNRYATASEVLVLSMEAIKPAFLLVKDVDTGANKGVLFEERLAKTGAHDKAQLYGEIGLDHGPEYLHGKITGLATS